jgi:hypothetical protein
MKTSRVVSIAALTLCVVVAALGTSSPNLAARRARSVSPTIAVAASFDTCLIDSAGNQLQWNSTTGAYTFTRASDGFMLSGTGVVRLVNGIRTLRDFKTDRRLSAGFNTGQLTGTATIYLMVAQGVWQVLRIIDTNPSATCTPPPVITEFVNHGTCTQFITGFIVWTSTGSTSAVLEDFRSDGLLRSSTPVATSGSIAVADAVLSCFDKLTLVVTGPGGTATQTITV